MAWSTADVDLTTLLTSQNGRADCFTAGSAKQATFDSRLIGVGHCTHARLSYSDVAVLHLSKIIQSKKAFGKCCELGWPLPQSTVELRRELTIFAFPKLTGVADGVRT